MRSLNFSQFVEFEGREHVHEEVLKRRPSLHTIGFAPERRYAVPQPDVTRYKV